MARTDSLNNYLTDVATAIKTKKGDSTPINASNFDTEIANLPSGETYPFNVSSLLISKPNATQSDIDDIATYTSTMSYSNLLLDRNAFNGGTFTDGSSILKNNNSCLVFKDLGTYTSSGSTAINLFRLCASMTIPPMIDFSQCFAYGGMFEGCTSLITLPSGYFSTIPSAKPHSTYNGYNPIGASRMFYGCSSLTFSGQETAILSNFTPYYANSMFEGCTSLITAPTMNLKNCYSANSMFKNCTNLVNVPYYDLDYMASFTGKFVSGGWFQNCPNLSDASLDNILWMLSTITSGTSRTLSRVISNGYGYNTRVKTCTHYQDFIDAGWTDNLTS